AAAEATRPAFGDAPASSGADHADASDSSGMLRTASLLLATRAARPTTNPVAAAGDGHTEQDTSVLDVQLRAARQETVTLAPTPSDHSAIGTAAAFIPTLPVISANTTANSLVVEPDPALSDPAHGAVAPVVVPAAAAAASLLAVAATALDLQAKGATFGAGGNETTSMTRGYTGSGITVGILSDSFNTSTSYDINGSRDTMATDIANGFLPGSTTVLKDSSGGTDEGRAMAQVVHEIAPGANILFETGNSTQQQFANNILDLAAHGAKVIVDDLGYYAEPNYQDGVIAQAIEKVESEGVVYLTAAGNDAAQGYEGAFAAGRTFTYGSQTFIADNFSTGGTALSNSLLKISTGQYGAVVNLEWESPAASAGGPGATSDLAIFLVDANGNLVSGPVSYTVGDAVVLGKDPYQTVFIPGAENTDYLEVGLLSGSAAPADLKITANDDDGNVTLGPVASNINAGTLAGHAAAPGVIAVGAAFSGNTPAYGIAAPVSETYSSAGPDIVTYGDNGQLLSTPRVAGVTATGVDGDITSFFEGPTGDYGVGYGDYFFGTSAAAPSLAGVAALMLQENGALTPSDVKNLLQDSATG
ncbi:S8 family serine peptidase, partial [Jatrophihabitans endophyticus]|uniref:S8 family peptidase n=1 Tax=Jatrophihabitans endophyticus TaxID=1206085 RepID=UPI001A0738DF